MDSFSITFLGVSENLGFDFNFKSARMSLGVLSSWYCLGGEESVEWTGTLLCGAGTRIRGFIV